MKKRIGIKLILSLVIVILLAVIFFYQHNRLKLYRNELIKKDNILENQTGIIEELENKRAFYEQPGDGIKLHGQLRVEGRQLSDCYGDPVQLRGVSSHGLTWFPRYTNAGSLKFWKDAGANVFRASLYSDQNRGYIHYPEESSNYLFLAVENALANDMYVIIDWHILYDSNPLENMEAAKEFFKEVSSHYEKNPGIIYEICNEPNGDTTWEDIIEYAHEIIPIIRTYAPEAIILVGMPNFCTDYRPVVENPLPYKNIMYTYHQYVNGGGEAYEMYNLNKMLEKNLPIFVSEWGIDMNTEEEVNFRATEEFLDKLEESNISWVVWALSNAKGAHALIRSETRKYGNFLQEDLTEVGLYVYERLREQTPCILQ